MTNLSKFRHGVILTLFALGLSACAGPDGAGGIYDPHEEKNRAIHEGNRDLDKALLKPAANVYGTVLPEPVRIGVGRFASNLSIPGTVVNDLLQFQLGDALHNTTRFLVNSTIGLAGLLDPASEAGLEARPSDFGETLHTWGANEGAYLELAVIGPSTTRDAVGKFVDLFLDPFAYVVPKPQRYALPVMPAISKLGDRYRFGGSVDSVLYDSADSYAQSRLLYLENRRFQLGQVVTEEEDLYEGLYDDLIPQ